MKFRILRLIAKASVLAKEEVTKELLYLLSPSRPRKVLFDHIPKCGGTSLTVYLQSNYPRRRTFTVNSRNQSAFVDKFRNFPQAKRYGYDLIIGHQSDRLIDFVHPECLKITVLRDPIDRVISNYYYASRSQTHPAYLKIHESDMSLEDYVTSGINTSLWNFYTTHFSGLSRNKIEQDPEESINSAIKALQSRYDIIGFLDDLSSFIEELRDQVGLRYEFPDKRFNVTRGRVSIENVPESTIDAIKNKNQLDIALYKRIKDTLGKSHDMTISLAEKLAEN